MAKLHTTSLLKFKKLRLRLGICTPLCLGHLELLWQQAHLSLNPEMPRSDVEASAEWEGEPGAFVAALIEFNWLDVVDEKTVVIHDYWDHAPTFVKGSIAAKNKKKAEPIGGPIGPPIGSPLGGPIGAPTYPILSNPIQSNSIKAHKGDPDLLNGGDPVSARNAPNGAMGGLKPEPERIGETMGRLQKTMQATQAQRLAARMAKYRDPPERTAWYGWYEKTVTDYLRSGGNVADIEELVKRVDDADDPAIRRAKDVGEFKEPGHWLVHEFQALMQARKIRWPTWPEVTVGVDAG